MAKGHVWHSTRGCYLSRAQAQRAVEVCAALWVEFGVSIRSATLAEAIVLRNAQAAEREPLAYAELPGVHFEAPLRCLEGHLHELQIAREANKFACAAILGGEPNRGVERPNVALC